MKNKFGFEVGIKQLWNESNHVAFIARGIDLENELAYSLYLERMEAAKREGVSEEELGAINGKGVVITVVDRFTHFISKTQLGAFVIMAIEFWTIDPYSYYH